MRAVLPWIATLGLLASAAVAAPHSPPVLGNSPPPPVLLSAAPPPPSALPSGSAASLPLPAQSGTCREHLPEGKARPKLTENVPAKGQSGHALTLSLELEHGKGETVLPGGFQTQSDDPNVRALEHAGLYLPDPDGGAGPVLTRTESGERATTKLTISFVPLPDKPGRNSVTIPSLPISIARASGDVLVLCTAAHTVTIEDPIANTSNPSPRLNPPARPQREEWTSLKNALVIGGVALVLGALVAWIVGKWLRRPRPLPAPPPPRPPWEVALEELFDVRHAGLIAEGRLAEHFDRVSDAVRKYLGARFGFDGLESTTREALGVLRETTPRIGPLDAIEGFLRQADLVKFAKTVPSAEDGELALVRAEHIVRETVPIASSVPLPPPAEAPPLEGSAPGAAAPLEQADPRNAEAQEWGPKPVVTASKTGEGEEKP
ncbi:MAG TPA: hypothetical protein VGQ57_16930 [Polyangiaceae bacterium]|nr:hypothetical protein [Polyangiaceae bacterium]